jgi:hypothetical protein
MASATRNKDSPDANLCASEMAATVATFRNPRALHEDLIKWTKALMSTTPDEPAHAAISRILDNIRLEIQARNRLSG